MSWRGQTTGWKPLRIPLRTRTGSTASSRPDNREGARDGGGFTRTSEVAAKHCLARYLTPSPREERAGGGGLLSGASSPRPSPPSDGGEGESNAKHTPTLVGCPAKCKTELRANCGR